MGTVWYTSNMSGYQPFQSCLLCNPHIKFLVSGTQYSSLDPAPDTRDPKHHRQSHLNPAPENRGPKAVVQHVPVLDPAPEPVNREWQNAPPVYPGYGAVPSTYPPQHVRPFLEYTFGTIHNVMLLLHILFSGSCKNSTSACKNIEKFPLEYSR